MKPVQDMGIEELEAAIDSGEVKCTSFGSFTEYIIAMES